jgi:ABC-type branched-subunit amino acid transport system substrate-binding protein
MRVSLAALLVGLAACTGSRGTAVPTTPANLPTTTVTTTTTAPPVRTGVGVQDGTIRLGVLAAITGPIPELGQSVLNGHEVWWTYVNEELGGVGGRYPVELVIEDNQYNPEINVTAFNGIKDGVLGVSSTLGTPITASIQQDAAAQSILVGAGSMASFWSLTPNVVLNLASNTYLAQFANGPYWAMQVADPPLMTAETRVGIISQADDYGQDCLKGYELALQNLGFQDASRQTYLPTDTDFSAQMSAFRAAGAEVVFVCALPSALARMIGTNAALGYNPVMFGSSPTYNVVLPAILGGGGGEQAGLPAFANYYQLGTGPAFEEDTPGMQLLRRNLETYGAQVPPQNVNAFFFFGYTQAQTFHAILERALQRGDLTREGLLAAVDEVQGVDLGYGMGEAGFGSSVTGRIPTNADAVGRPVSTSQSRFGLQRVSDFFVAPYLDTHDYGG